MCGCSYTSESSVYCHLSINLGVPLSKSTHLVFFLYTLFSEFLVFNEPRISTEGIWRIFLKVKSIFVLSVHFLLVEIFPQDGGGGVLMRLKLNKIQKAPPSRLWKQQRTTRREESGLLSCWGRFWDLRDTCKSQRESTQSWALVRHHLRFGGGHSSHPSPESHSSPTLL